MSAIQKLIEAVREWESVAPGMAEAAEAELNELGRNCDELRSFAASLSRKLQERNRADEELLAAVQGWDRASEGLNERKCLDAQHAVLKSAERWAAAKGGGK
jgi:hypothetical protein